MDDTVIVIVSRAALPSASRREAVGHAKEERRGKEGLSLLLVSELELQMAPDLRHLAIAVAVAVSRVGRPTAAAGGVREGRRREGLARLLVVFLRSVPSASVDADDEVFAIERLEPEENGSAREIEREREGVWER